MGDVVGWVMTIALVALLWGVGFWFGSDHADRAERWRRR
jgi:hypothetical protein